MGEQKAKRFRFEQDDSGHHYIIPAELKEEFSVWVEDVGSKYDWMGTPFDEYRCSMHPSCYTFIDPKIDYK